MCLAMNTTVWAWYPAQSSCSEPFHRTSRSILCSQSAPAMQRQVEWIERCCIYLRLQMTKCSEMCRTDRACHPESSQQALCDNFPGIDAKFLILVIFVPSSVRLMSTSVISRHTLISSENACVVPVGRGCTACSFVCNLH